MIIKILNFIFGEKPAHRFTRIIVFIVAVSVSVMLILNVGCGIKDGKFWFEWKPADVKIDYKKGQ